MRVNKILCDGCGAELEPNLGNVRCWRLELMSYGNGAGQMMEMQADYCTSCAVQVPSLLAPLAAAGGSSSRATGPGSGGGQPPDQRKRK